MPQNAYNPISTGIDLSIVILNYKSRGLALNCIKSIKESDLDGLKCEIIVVDNDSDDMIGDILSWQYPDIRFIKNPRNVGMGAGNNVGIRAASGNFIVIANPDVIVFKETLKTLHAFMSREANVGVVGPKQYYPDKTVQDSCYRWYGLWTPIYRRTPLGGLKWAERDVKRFLMSDFDHTHIKEVDWLLGSFLFCRADVLRKIGMFDERFFLYFEDTDLCKRFWQAGYKVVYDPEAEIIHNHTRESAKQPWYRFFSSVAARQHLLSWFKYLAKWGTK